MISVPAKQENANSPSGSQIPAESPIKASSPSQFPMESPIEARPLQSVKPLENGNGCEEKKVEREHKKRSKNWTRVETTTLIRIRSEMDPRFCRSGRKSDLWDEISELLKAEGMRRDPQQCRDKWEKLTAGYKEVRDGVRDKGDYPFYDDLDPILSTKFHRPAADPTPEPDPDPDPDPDSIRSDGEETEDAAEFPPSQPPSLKRRHRPWAGGEEAVVEAMKDALESLMERQHRFFADIMEAMERRERIRERIWLEREEKWREEERAQRQVFQNAMVLLTKRLVGGCASDAGNGCGSDPSAGERGVGKVEGGGGGEGSTKKRSKNWKRVEVLQLIKLRTEMEGRFSKSTRRAALWEELAGLMCAEGVGVKRDGKQCREKWDKLMAQFKDAADGKRDRLDTPYYADLLARGSSSIDNPTAVTE